MSKLKGKINGNIQDTGSNVNSKDVSDDNNYWDSELDNFSQQLERLNAENLKNQNNKPTIDHDNHEDNVTMQKNGKSSNKKESIKTVIFIIFILTIILSIIILFVNNTAQDHKNFTLSNVKKNAELPKNETKKTISSINNDDSNKSLQNTDPLSHIEFDFSPVISYDIERNPILPNRVKKQTQATTASEFNDIWKTSDMRSNEEENKKKINAADYLPPWRKFSTNYSPTEGFPIFSIILEYDSKTLDIDDLPNGSGYNIVISGFLENSETTLQKLRQKGYEVLLYLPMDEELNALNFKPINTQINFDSIRDAVAFHTSRLGGNGFIGFMNYGGKEIQNDLSKINFTMSLLQKTGYLYVDNIYKNEQSLAFAAAEGHNVPTLKVKHYIKSVEKEFPHFIKEVTIDGQGIAIVKANADNIKALQKYETILKSNQTRRVPLTGIIKHQMVKQFDPSIKR